MAPAVATVLAAAQPQRQRHGRVQRRAADVAAGVAAAQEGETDGQAEAPQFSYYWLL